MDTEYRYVGVHADSLEGGRVVGPGDFTGPIDPDEAQNAHLIEEGKLLEVPNGTFEKHQKALAKAEADAGTEDNDDNEEEGDKG